MSKNNKAPKSNKDKLKTRGRINSVVTVLLCLTLLMGTGGFFLLSSILATAKPVNIGDFSSDGNSRILDAEGKVIIELGKENRENVKYDQVPQVVVDAFLAIEDSRYYKHNGFDMPRFMKSALNNLKTKTLGQGGSTLTMQMVDVTYFQDDQKLDDAGNPIQPSGLDKIKYKIQEIFMSMEAESKGSKKEIIEKYLNKINFGGTSRGIQKGAQLYFGKDVTQLTLSEAAFLAGVVNAPNYYNPYTSTAINYNGEVVDHYKEAVKRRNTTLELMLYHGYISEDEYKLAISDELAFQLNGSSGLAATPMQSYIDVVVKETKDLTGKDPYTTPMDIYTPMDRGAQELSDNLLNGVGIDYPNDDFQTGFTAINNQTGEILSMGGGRGYGGDSRHNRANDWAHQPGSSIKPLLDYSLAFEYLGWATSHVVEDKPYTYKGTNFVVGNANGAYVGDVSLQYAVAHSLNTTAISTLEQVVDKIGTEETVKIMHLMGFTEVKEKEFDLGYGIGGSNMYATPTQMAGAYQIFANGGKYIKPHTVKKIEFHDGSETIEPSYDPIVVISEQSAYLMSILLENAVSTNWGNLLHILSSNGAYPVYAKSGTSDWGEAGKQYGIPEGSMKDKWIVAYTSDVTVATWAGYDVPGPNHYVTTNAMNFNVPGHIDDALLDYFSSKKKPEGIAKPEGIVPISHINGLFPYATAPAGTPSTMVVNGFINSKFAQLKTLEPDPITNLTDFSAKYDPTTGLLSGEFAPYSDLTKLIQATSVVDYGNGLSGKRIFDKSFVFGPIVYRLNVKSNDVSLGTFDFANNKYAQAIALPASGNVKACGYYTYKNFDLKSNEKCVEVKSEPTVADVTKKMADGNYKLASDYAKLFESGKSSEEVKVDLEAFIAAKMPDVKIDIKFVKEEGADGSLAANTLQVGSVLKPNNTVPYIISIIQK
ncbi:MAG: transglycosylase domain-containing protein [Erysipelotrichaceae bacterium]